MIRTLMLVVLLLVGSQSFSQFKSTSFFGPVEKVKLQYKYTTESGITKVGLVDSSVLAENVVHIAVAIGYTTNNQIATGTGPFWLHLKYNTTTQNWTAQYGAGVMIWAAGAAVPTIRTPGVMVGPAITLLNGWVTLGVPYDFTNKRWTPVFNVSYSFLK